MEPVISQIDTEGDGGSSGEEDRERILFQNYSDNERNKIDIVTKPPYAIWSLTPRNKFVSDISYINIDKRSITNRTNYY